MTGCRQVDDSLRADAQAQDIWPKGSNLIDLAPPCEGGADVRIFVVEDDPDLGEALQRQLRRDGHGVDWETDGHVADEILQFQTYDLVVLDINLPERDRAELLRRMRARGSRTPVLMLTARAG